jgi:hypothetical protein
MLNVFILNFLQKANVSQSAIEMAGVFFNIEQWYGSGLIEVSSSFYQKNLSDLQSKLDFN